MDPAQLLPEYGKALEVMEHFAGTLEYMSRWVWKSDQLIEYDDRMVFRCDSLPLVVDEAGGIDALPFSGVGQLVFPEYTQAFQFMHQLCRRDLQYRGFRDDRLRTFDLKMAALLRLHLSLDVLDEAEYEQKQQEWAEIRRPPYAKVSWSPEQQQALDTMQAALRIDDEDTKAQSRRWLYIAGAPGSGKSRVILEMAVFAAQNGIRTCT